MAKVWNTFVKSYDPWIVIREVQPKINADSDPIWQDGAKALVNLKYYPEADEWYIHDMEAGTDYNLSNTDREPVECWHVGRGNGD